MELILWSLAIMGFFGILFGISLAIAGRFFSVKSEPRAEQVLAALPGINCGACGYAGCEAYAKAVAGGERPGLCVPGGQKVAEAVAAIMGVKLDTEVRTVRAVVHCQGGDDNCGQRYEYDGLPDCKAAHLLQAGPKNCEYGCLGFGNCARVCPFGAITMGDDRIPIVDWDKCTGCGTCVRECPRHLIETLPTNITHCVACSSQDKGKAVKDVCKVGCIACWICVRVSAEGAIEKNGNLPRLTYPAGADYSAALEKCPMHCYVKIERAAVVEKPAAA